MLDELKIAIVCDWLTVFGGAERVIFEIHNLFPNAPIYTSLFHARNCNQFSNAKIIESGLKKFPFARNFHRIYFPFMPKIFETMDFSEFDIVISSSHSAAKGIITKPETLHVTYCHSPMRYIWDRSHSYQSNFSDFKYLKFFYKPILHKIRKWDRLAAERPDQYIANSAYISKRIKKYYKKDSKIIYPPVNLEKFRVSRNHLDFYLAVGRLIPYKKFDLLVDTFNKNSLPLKIVGTGSEFRKLRKIAKSNIEFLGHISDEELYNYYSQSKALIFPQMEDFGIVPLEAMASGTPVIAYAGGGALETVENGTSGILFDEQSPDSLNEAIIKFNSKSWDPDLIASTVDKFSASRFKTELLHYLEKSWKEHKEMLVLQR